MTQISKYILDAQRPVIEEQNRQIGEIFGIKVVSSSTVPEGEAHFIQDGKIIGKIVCLAPNDKAQGRPE